jgi:hypothetical protein|uniref:hypothetical protein n=1 Tax=Gelidibacter sp. TaxID=2018083 RepID=UPI00404B7BE7
MKKIIFLLLIAISFSSCSVDDDANNFYYEILPIESVIIPEEFELGQTYEITVTYLRPTTCHVFNNFYYESELNQRTIAVVTTVYQNNDCLVLIDEEAQATFNFMVNSNGTYVFKFWQGEDENGNDLYYIVEVPVVE